MCKQKLVTQRLKSVLIGDRELSPLLNQVQALTALQRHFSSIAPAYLAESSQVLGLHQGILSVSVANATIAAKLRQLAPELAVLLQSRGCQVSGIRVKVQVSFASDRPKPVPRKLSQAAQSALQELSSGMRDSPLKLALEKIARKK